MIFEMRTYLMKPGSIPEVEKRWAAGIDARAKLSRFGGFWRSEVGTLNQIIHVWPYKDLNERAAIRAKAIEMGVWPVKMREFILEMESKILHAAPFSPAFEPGQHGGIYEFRTYTYGPTSIPKVIESWGQRIKQRTAALLEVVRRAAQADPELGALWQGFQEQFMADQRRVADRLAARGALRPGLEVAGAAETLGLLNHPSVYYLAVVERGWSEERFEQWLAEAFVHHEQSPASGLPS